MMIMMKMVMIMIIMMMIMMMMTVKVKAAPMEKNAETTNDDRGDDRQKRETFDIMSTLSNYGYLPKNPQVLKGQLMSDEAVRDAIRQYQRFNGLEVTGEPNVETMEKMRSPRCGFPDIIRKDGEQGIDFQGDDIYYSQDQPQAFTTLSTRWMKDTVYWKPTTLTRKLSEGAQWTAFQRALDLWADVIPLKFRYSPTDADMKIKFASGDHGDGWQNRFNGKGGVLAHAYSPGNGLGGDTHFDDDEDWTIDTGRGSDLTIVAAHEFGHALGLGHSNVQGALMAPYYSYSDELVLHPDDVRGIQGLYGPRVNPTTEPPTTITTTSTTTTTTRTTPTTTTTEVIKPLRPDFCHPSFRVDAISKGPDGFMYVFRLSHIYKIGNLGLEPSFPRYISDVFHGAPGKHIRAATFVPTTGKSYLFKDSRVWRFTGFDLDPGYPKMATDSETFKPSSAITLTHSGVSQIFLFGQGYFWEWSTVTERMVPGYPLLSYKYFPSAPGHPDASYMNEKGNLFFFKYNRLRTLRYRGDRPITYPIGSSIFGPVCGTNTENPDLVTLEPPRAAEFSSPVKYNEVEFSDSSDDSSSTEFAATDKTSQGKQPLYYYNDLDSPMIKSLLINREEEEERNSLMDEERLLFNEKYGSDEILDDFISWSNRADAKRSFGMKKKKQGYFNDNVRRIEDYLTSYDDY